VDWPVVVGMVPQLAKGAGLTLQLLFLSGVFGIAMAIPMALLRIARNPWINALPRLYIYFFRGTPLLVQLFLVYYGLGQFQAVRESLLWPVLRDAYWCAVLTFSFHTAAYCAEILRGAIQAVPAGEVEAARAMGMRPTQVYSRIIMPRAFRIFLPAYGNEIILMLKASALASTITLLDLTGVARTLYARNYLPVETFVTAGLFYLVITCVLAFCVRWLENRLHREREVPARVIG